MILDLARRMKRGLSEQRLRRDIQAVRKDCLTYLSIAKLRRLEKALGFMERARVPGDVLEFGVALGGSAIVLAGHANNDRRFHGFDVFAMIPPPTSEKDDDKSRERYAVIASGASEGIGGDDYYGYRSHLFEDVVASFARHGRPVDGDRIQLHKGLFEETWPAVSVDRVAFAHVDCDWYDPVKYCLEAIADKMSVQGVMLIDDYNDYAGARAAVDEFVAARPDFVLELGDNPIIRKVAAQSRMPVA